jgi:fructose-1,6-bisphosphatase/inositol monophosphatase family enzyme
MRPPSSASSTSRSRASAGWAAPAARRSSPAPWAAVSAAGLARRSGKAELSCTSPDIFTEATRPGFDRLRAAVRRTSWGGDCYAFGLLALGQIDVIVESDLKPWDWAALVPVIEGAGGSVTDWAGAPLRLDGPGCVLALGDARLLAEALRLLG